MELIDIIRGKGLSVYRVAVNGDIPYSTINSVTTGVKPFEALNYRNIKKIAKGLNMDTLELLKLIEDK